MHTPKSSLTCPVLSKNLSRRSWCQWLAGLAAVVLLGLIPGICRAQSDLPLFFSGSATLGNDVYYLALPNGNIFGYYADLSNTELDQSYIYHFDLGYEYVMDANDGERGIYLYDFASDSFFYTSPTFAFPYLYSFLLKSVVYYFPDTSNAGRYTTGPRYFYDFGSAEIIEFPTTALTQ